MRKLDGTGLQTALVFPRKQPEENTHETLVPLGVVVLKTNLELDGLNEVPLLTTGLLVVLEGGLVEDGPDRPSHA